MSLAQLLDGHRVVVCVGTGGVGKTTVSASLALHAAMQGRRAMVLTIDPAQRLAQSLGLDTLRSGGEVIPERLVHEAGLELPGELSAGMLDQKSAWDDFIGRHAPNSEIRNAILDNDFYLHLSQSFAGSVEYMAIEELCRVEESNDYDLIVLDTPPTGHALDFLEAPARLEAFLDRNVVSWLVKPYVSVGWSAWKGGSRTVQFLLQKIEDATGLQTLSDVSKFFIAMEELFDGIADRSRKVRALLRGDSTAFVLVAACEEQVLGEAEDLTAKMEKLGVSLKAVVMNRVHLSPAVDAEVSADAVSDLLERASVAGADPALAGWLRQTFSNAYRTALAEAVRREAFEAELPSGVVSAAIPEMPHDVHDLRALAVIASYLSA